MMIRIPREFSNGVNWCLDNLIPPVIRDSKVFMSLMMRAILGPKYKYYMEFKKAVPHMADSEIDSYYSLLADTFMKRETDLNKGSASLIVNSIIGESVIDVGCGGGYLVREIIKSGKKPVYGFDLSIAPETKGGAVYQNGTILHMPYADKSFDTVICAHVLEHIRDIHQGLTEIRRIAAKRLIIVVPCQREYKYTFDLHIHFFPYLHDFENLIKSPNARFYKIRGDFICIEELS